MDELLEEFNRNLELHRGKIEIEIEEWNRAIDEAYIKSLVRFIEDMKGSAIVEIIPIKPPKELTGLPNITPIPYPKI